MAMRAKPPVAEPGGWQWHGQSRSESAFGIPAGCLWKRPYGWRDPPIQGLKPGQVFQGVLLLCQDLQRRCLVDFFGLDLLPGLLGKFRETYPNIHLEVRTDIGINLIPLFEKGELDLVVTGKDAYQGSCRVLFQEPLIWVIGEDAIVSLPDVLHLVLLPPPCSLRKMATEGLQKANREWEVLFTGTSIANIQAAVQAGMGLSILPKGALRDGLRKAPSHWELPELPMYSIVLVIQEQKANDARDVFIGYLEAELNKLR